MLKVYPLLFILLLVVSCSNRNVQVAKILTDFQKNEIVIPDNLIRIEKGKVLGIVNFDNYDELTLNENDISFINTNIKVAVVEYFRKYGIVYKT